MTEFKIDTKEEDPNYQGRTIVGGAIGLSIVALAGAGVLSGLIPEQAQAREPTMAAADPVVCRADGYYVKKFERGAHDYARLEVFANCGKGKAPWFRWVIKESTIGQEPREITRSHGSMTQIEIPSMDTALSGTVDVGYKSEAHTLPVPFHISESETYAQEVVADQ